MSNKMTRIQNPLPQMTRFWSLEDLLRVGPGVIALAGSKEKLRTMFFHVSRFRARSHISTSHTSGSAIPTFRSIHLYVCLKEALGLPTFTFPPTGTQSYTNFGSLESGILATCPSHWKVRFTITSSTGWLPHTLRMWFRVWRAVRSTPMMRRKHAE